MASQDAAAGREAIELEMEPPALPIEQPPDERVRSKRKVAPTQRRAWSSGKCRRENCQLTAAVSVQVDDETMRLCNSCAQLFWHRMLAFKSGF